ncbi:MAG: hypothetical protein Q9223_006885 [Gallowayella weberi]
MLFSTSSICFVAAMLFNSSLADRIAIAFGNIAFNGMTFGTPFHLKWFGGDGTPVDIILNQGHPLNLQAVGSVATGLTTTSYSWTPVASKVVKPGVPYVLSIVQSGLTNYSPYFTIAARPAASGLLNAAREPLPVNAAGYYPIPRPQAPEDNLSNNIFPDATGAPYPRRDATGVIIPRNGPTGVMIPRRDATGVSIFWNDPTGVIVPLHDATRVKLPRNDATDAPIASGFVSRLLATGSYAASYPTGTGAGTGSSVSYPTGGPYNNVSKSGSGSLGAAYTSDPRAPISGADRARVMGLALAAFMTLVSAGCISLMV